MPSETFQTLIKTIKNGDFSQFEDFFLYYKEMDFLDLKDSEDFEKISDNREKCYYLALAKLLTLLSYYRGTGDEAVIFNEFSQLINISDKLGIFIEVKKIPFRFKIIAELHLDGMQKGLIGRIFVIIRFFNKYNLFERNLSSEELRLIEDIKKNDKPLIANLRDLFGTVSNSLIYYSCKIMPYDLLLSNEERIRNFLNNPEYRSELRGRLLSLNYLKTWTDWYSMYGLSVRNLGSIHQFLDKFEEKYDGVKKVIEFDIIYRTFYFDDDEDHEFHEIKKHFVSPENILKNKDKFIEKNNYNFYSISMVLLGGLGPQGLGFTYSTPRGEIIEICSDQKENEAIIIKFKQYLKRKFLAKLENEMERLGVKTDIIESINSYLSEILNPEDLVSYNDMDSILKKIKNLVDYEFQQYKFELDEIMSKISKVFSKIYSRKIKIWFKLFFKRRVLGRLEKEMENLDVDVDIRRRIKNFLLESTSPKDFFKYYDDNSISEAIAKLLSDEFQQLNEDIINKTSKAVSMILREIKLKDQFMTRMDLVEEGKIKSEDIAKLTSLRGKSHYDVLRERFFFQNEINWFFKDYSNEIKDLEERFLIL